MSPLAIAAKVFGEEEGKDSQTADRASSFFLILSSYRLGCVFNNKNIIFFFHVHYLIHVRALAEKVYGDDGFCFLSDSRFDFLKVNVESDRIDVDKNRACIEPMNGVVITSSPGLVSMAMRGTIRASVPEEISTAYRVPE